MSVEIMADMWDRYERDVVPKDASDIQRQETKRTFYAAAFAMLMNVCEVAEKLSDEKAEAHLQFMQQECMAFSLTVEQGNA